MTLIFAIALLLENKAKKCNVEGPEVIIINPASTSTTEVVLVLVLVLLLLLVLVGIGPIRHDDLGPTCTATGHFGSRVRRLTS